MSVLNSEKELRELVATGDDKILVEKICEGLGIDTEIFWAIYAEAGRSYEFAGLLTAHSAGVSLGDTLNGSRGDYKSEKAFIRKVDEISVSNPFIEDALIELGLMIGTIPE